MMPARPRSHKDTKIHEALCAALCLGDLTAESPFSAAFVVRFYHRVCRQVTTGIGEFFKLPIARYTFHASTFSGGLTWERYGSEAPWVIDLLYPRNLASRL